MVKFHFMIKVLRHGNKIAVKNPATGREEVMVDVVFIELGRGGANSNLSQSQQFLNELEGEDVGLPGIRVHTQPILEAMVGKYPPGRSIDGFVNRRLYSTPQMPQQEGRPAREIDGKPTYFVTYLSKTAAEDEDFRDSNELLAKTHPEMFNGTQKRSTQVRVLEEAINYGDPDGILNGDSGNPSLASPKVVANQGQ